MEEINKSIEEINKSIEDKKVYKVLRKKSLCGLIIFIISIVVLYFYINNLLIGILGIISLITGWFIFSNNHTKIASLQIKSITDEYLKEKFKK